MSNPEVNIPDQECVYEEVYVHNAEGERASHSEPVDSSLLERLRRQPSYMRLMYGITGLSLATGVFAPHVEARPQPIVPQGYAQKGSFCEGHTFCSEVQEEKAVHPEEDSPQDESSSSGEAVFLEYESNPLEEGVVPEDESTTPRETPPSDHENHRAYLPVTLRRANIHKQVHISTATETAPSATATSAPTDEPSPTSTPSVIPTITPPPTPYGVVLEEGVLEYFMPDNDSLRREREEDGFREYLGEDAEGSGFACFKAPEVEEGVVFVANEDVEVYPQQVRPPEAVCAVGLSSQAEVHRVNTGTEPLKQIILRDEGPVRSQGETTIDIQLTNLQEDGTLPENQVGAEFIVGRGARAEMNWVPYYTLRPCEDRLELVDGGFVFKGTETSPVIPLPADGNIRLRYPVINATEVYIETSGSRKSSGNNADPEIQVYGPFPISPYLDEWEDEYKRIDDVFYTLTDIPAGREFHARVQAETTADHTPEDNPGLVVNNGLREAARIGIARHSEGSILDDSIFSLRPEAVFQYDLAEIPQLARYVRANLDRVMVGGFMLERHTHPVPEGFYDLDILSQSDIQAFTDRTGISIGGSFSIMLDEKSDRDRYESAQWSKKIQVLQEIEARKIRVALDSTSYGGTVHFHDGCFYTWKDIEILDDLYRGNIRRMIASQIEMMRTLRPDVRFSADFPTYMLDSWNHPACVDHPFYEPCFTPETIGDMTKVEGIDEVFLYAWKGKDYMNPAYDFTWRKNFIAGIHAHKRPDARLSLIAIMGNDYRFASGSDEETTQYINDLFRLYYGMLDEGVLLDFEVARTDMDRSPFYHLRSSSPEDLAQNGFQIRLDPLFYRLMYEGLARGSAPDSTANVLTLPGMHSPFARISR